MFAAIWVAAPAVAAIAWTLLTAARWASITPPDAAAVELAALGGRLAARGVPFPPPAGAAFTQKDLMWAYLMGRGMDATGEGGRGRKGDGKGWAGKRAGRRAAAGR